MYLGRQNVGREFGEVGFFMRTKRETIYARKADIRRDEKMVKFCGEVYDASTGDKWSGFLERRC